MKPTGGYVDEYIERITPAVRKSDAATLVQMMREITGREPEMWGTIIGFGSCHYVYPTGTEGDMPLLAFSPRKSASTVYLFDTNDYSAELATIGPHIASKACLYFKSLDKIDLTVLRAILQDSYDRITAEESPYGTITVRY